MTTPRSRPSQSAGRPPFLETSSAGTVAHTKVRAPVLRDDAVARGRLLQTVREALERYPVVVLSAPAGYGKTTLLASLPVACPEAHLVWLSLEDDDNDPARFVNAFAAALSVVAPSLGERGGFDDMGSFVDTVINELVGVARERVVLVMDEFEHLHEAEVLRAVARLAERAPRGLRLAIAARRQLPLPIARWRARRIVGEIRLEELAFTPEEAREYLAFAHELDISDAEARVLTESVEGWPAATTLLARALTAGVAASDVVSSHHRDIDALIEQEIFAGLDPNLGSFLLETSILPELTPSLCQAVTARPEAPSLLEEVVRLNLAVPVADRTRHAMRYQGMFRRFLERRLVVELPELVPTLERRSAEARARLARQPVRVPETGETLSPREVEVLRLVAGGASNAQIAEALFISIHTVKRHVAALLAKLGAESRSRAVAVARQLGIIA